jgi:hypothetical protein
MATLLSGVERSDINKERRADQAARREEKRRSKDVSQSGSTTLLPFSMYSNWYLVFFFGAIVKYT